MNRVEQILALLKSHPADNFLEHALALEYVKAGREDEACVLFEGILQRDPAYTGSYYHLAKLLEKRGDLPQAKTWYEKGMLAAKAAGDMKTYNELQAAYDDMMD